MGNEGKLLPTDLLRIHIFFSAGKKICLYYLLPPSFLPDEPQWLRGEEKRRGVEVVFVALECNGGKGNEPYLANLRYCGLNGKKEIKLTHGPSSFPLDPHAHPAIMDGLNITRPKAIGFYEENAKPQKSVITIKRNPNPTR